MLHIYSSIVPPDCYWESFEAVYRKVESVVFAGCKVADSVCRTDWLLPHVALYSLVWIECRIDVCLPQSHCTLASARKVQKCLSYQLCTLSTGNGIYNHFD